MKALLALALVIGLTTPALAQRRGGGGFGGMRGGVGMGIGPGRGGGPVVSRGGFGARGPGFRSPGFRNPGFGSRAPVWRIRPGWGGTGWGGGWGRGGGWGWGGGFGIWPGWGWGGGFVSGFSTPAYYSDPWPPAPYPVYSYAPAPAPAPVIIINQTPPAYEPRYVQPRERVAEPEADEVYRPITYEIAFKDGTALTALAYWVRERTLNYVTQDFKIHTAPVGSVDRARSRELNRAAGIGLRLPPEL